MALNLNALFGALMGDGKAGTPRSMPASTTPSPRAKASGADEGIPLGTYDDEELLELWTRFKRESLDDRWVFERQWHRNILYVLGRQWIEYFARQGGWKDKRMAPWIPRPVTNKCKETVQAIRAMFTSIKLGVNVRPNGSEPKNVSAAATADEMHPLLHEDHSMDNVMTEGDFWLTTTGNSFLHTFLDYDLKYGALEVRQVECLSCGEVRDETVEVCPVCESPDAQEQIGDDGKPVTVLKPKGKPVTIPLSPLELAFPNHYARFDDLPYVIRLRWRTKSYFENHPKLKTMVVDIAWQKTPTDQSLALFRSLSSHNDLGVAPAYLADGVASSSNSEDGIQEYEVWLKPTDAYPHGLVFRVIGDKSPKILHLEEEEALPGPIPYTDAKGQPLFTFAHAGYDHVGGRILASGPLDVIIQKQDQLNQLDSMIQLIIQRMSNPVWLEPKGAEIEKLTGMPGLVIKWNPLTVGGNAKPERIDGIGPDASLFQIREQYLKDIEELAGTFDIVKGAKPTGVEAFSALQLLVERSQSRFAGVFSSRGKLYRDWFKFAIELEREFGESARVHAVMTPARTWTFTNFKNADLQGSVSVIVEDGTMTPKTSLGMRAALEHANQLRMLDMNDPDQRYEGLKLFGLTRMAPTLDIHVQSALQKQQAFEEWAQNPQAQQQSMAQTEQAFAAYQQTLQATPPDPNADPNVEPAMPPPPSQLEFTPLKWRPWFNAAIHRQEFVKWANGDRVRELLLANPGLETLLVAHLAEIDNAMMTDATRALMLQNPMPPQTPSSGAMGRSNNESTKGNEPKGAKEGAQQQGPA